MDDNRVPEHDFDRWCRERGVEPGPESFAEYLGSVSGGERDGEPEERAEGEAP